MKTDDLVKLQSKCEAAQKELSQIKMELNKLLQTNKSISDAEIKAKEMSDFLFEMFNKCEQRFTGDENTKEFTFYKGKEWIYQQDYKNGYLWISYSLVWKVFEDKYKLNYQQIKYFISSWVETNTNWNGLTPQYNLKNNNGEVETNTNWNGLTPIAVPWVDDPRVETNTNWKGLTPVCGTPLNLSQCNNGRRR